MIKFYPTEEGDFAVYDESGNIGHVDSGVGHILRAELTRCYTSLREAAIYLGERNDAAYEGRPQPEADDYRVYRDCMRALGKNAYSSLKKDAEAIKV